MARLIAAIVSTLIWEAMLVALFAWGLPLLGIRLHVLVLFVAMLLLAVYAVVSYRIGTRALSRKAVVGMADMVGSKGKVVEALKPEGMVIIEGELWAARPLGGNIEKGQKVVVVQQDGFKLFVRRRDSDKAGRTG